MDRHRHRTADGLHPRCRDGGRRRGGRLEGDVELGSVVPDDHPLRRRYSHQYPAAGVARGRRPRDHRGARAVRPVRWRTSSDGCCAIIATGLGVDPGCSSTRWSPRAPPSTVPSTTRRWPTAPGAGNGGTSPHVWAAEHGDINLITALPRASGPGLQVRVGGDGGDGEWIDAIPPDDHVVLNTGMMLERLTNGVLPAGRHRVVAAPGETGRPPVGGAVPAPVTVDGPGSAGLVHRRARPQRWAPIEAGAWLDQVLWDINLIERS